MLDGRPIAQIEGNATLDVNVKVDQSPDFWSKVDTRINNKINAFSNNYGTPATGTTGSKGETMPEVWASQR